MYFKQEIPKTRLRNPKRECSKNSKMYFKIINSIYILIRIPFYLKIKNNFYHFK